MTLVTLTSLNKSMSWHLTRQQHHLLPIVLSLNHSIVQRKTRSKTYLNISLVALRGSLICTCNPGQTVQRQSKSHWSGRPRQHGIWREKLRICCEYSEDGSIEHTSSWSITIVAPLAKWRGTIRTVVGSLCLLNGRMEPVELRQRWGHAGSRWGAASVTWFAGRARRGRLRVLVLGAAVQLAGRWEQPTGRSAIQYPNSCHVWRATVDCSLGYVYLVVPRDALMEDKW